MATAGAKAVRFAFVGCGTIARHHLGALKQSSHATVVTAVVDVNRERAEKLLKLLPRTQEENSQKCKIFTSLSDALRWGEFDAVIVMVPHHLHEPLATECLQAGKHLLLEKTMAHTVESCQRILKQAEGAQQVFMVGENSIFWPEVKKAKELIESGMIGEPYFAQANYWESIGSMTFYEDIPGEDDWFFDPARAGGGVLMNGATHWVRPLRLWFGDIVEVVGMLGYPFQSVRQRSESLAHAMLRFGSGKTAVLHCHYTDIPMYPLPFFQIFGDKGEITIDGSFDGGISLRTRDNPKGQHLGSLGGYMASFGPQMEAFLDAVVNSGKQNAMEDSPRQALQEVLVAKAVYKSARTGKWESTALDNLTGTDIEQS